MICSTLMATVNPLPP